MGQDVTRPIGLIAGAGRFPISVAEKARAVGQPLVCVGLKHMADPALADLATHYYPVGIGKMGRIIRCFRREGVERWMMAGKVYKTILFRRFRWLSLWPDLGALRFWYSRLRRDNRDDSLLLA